jgi:hypothetical protein
MVANAVVDISHHNGRVNLQKAADSGLIGVIQKATQGEAYVDRTFGRNRKAALDAGLLFGAYHFGTGANGVSQAVHFLDTVQPDKKTVVVLDFEDNPTGSSMTLQEAACLLHARSHRAQALAGFLQRPHHQASAWNDRRSDPEKLCVLACAIRSDAGCPALLVDMDLVAIHRWRRRDRNPHSRSRDRQLRSRQIQRHRSAAEIVVGEVALTPAACPEP